MSNTHLKAARLIRVIIRQYTLAVPEACDASPSGILCCASQVQDTRTTGPKARADHVRAVVRGFGVGRLASARTSQLLHPATRGLQPGLQVVLRPARRAALQMGVGPMDDALKEVISAHCTVVPSTRVFASPQQCQLSILVSLQ